MNKIRLPFDFTPESVERLDEMRSFLGGSRATMIRLGLQILDHVHHLTKEHGKGHLIFRTNAGIEWGILPPVSDAFWKRDQRR